MPKTLSAWPAWLKKDITANKDLFDTKAILASEGVNTVCESSLCPNLNECFSRRFATFMILGDACTRHCGFCAVGKALPGEPDKDEALRILRAIRRLGLRHAVITSVTRDDLPSKGADEFAMITRQIRSFDDRIRIELLVPDFGGDEILIRKVTDSSPDIFGHNMETVKRLYRTVRPEADYLRSLGVLRTARDTKPGLRIKSGMMVGLGETEVEVFETMRDAHASGCDIFVIGQYLRPGSKSLPVKRFVEENEYKRYIKIGEELGFKNVHAAPFARSSYLADELLFNLEEVYS